MTTLNKLFSLKVRSFISSIIVVSAMEILLKIVLANIVLVALA